MDIQNTVYLRMEADFLFRFFLNRKITFVFAYMYSIGTILLNEKCIDNFQCRNKPVIKCHHQ